ncbi:MAG TPA: dienelactone hydrolase family protein [Ktedonobacterales bacterium]|nr:dienelactone hydrolase family protein [Ktedonobacterales bacterium]
MMEQPDQVLDPHRGQPPLTAGEPLDRARAAMVMVHGRGASAADILLFAGELAQPRFAYLAPQAANHTWYPNSFLAPIASNEPHLSSALATLDGLLAQTVASGIPLERVMLLGFSQGACLMLEYVARHARRYGGVVGWSGGLIGPDGTPRAYPGSLAGAPVFLGCSDVDPHIPLARVELTADIMRRLGGEVTMRVYPDMDHTVNQDEITFVRGMMATLVA